MVQRLCIVGLGLMGGAVGIAARRSGTVGRILGVGDRPETIEKAKTIGAVDEAILDLASAVRDADLIVLAVPVRLIPEVAIGVIQSARHGAVMTDIASSKATVVGQVEKIMQEQKSNVFFVGSHPITGSEKAGIEASREVQLSGATCVLTPTSATDNDAYQKVDEFWKSLGMKTMRLSPKEHDAVLARSSHLPHLLSYALINAQTDRSLNLSGPGLRDMTRLSGSEIALWTDIFAQNATELHKVVKEYGEEIVRLAQEIEMLAQKGTPGSEAARERIFRYLADAKQRHDKRFTTSLGEEGSREANLRALTTQFIPQSPKQDLP